jgi:lysophospholipase L1-like esterase
VTALRAGFLALAFALALPSGAVAQGLPAGARYVAIGDSFASGLQLGPPDAGTPPRCSRTAASYAHLVAQRLNLVLADATCSSAKTEHVLGKWDELPPQIDAVTPDTRLVTVTIGANDVRYVSDFFAGLCRLFPETRAKPECALPPPLPDQAAWTALEANLRLIAAQVRTRAPAARLVFVDYLALLPRLVLCDRTPLTPAEAADRRAVGDRLRR